MGQKPLREFVSEVHVRGTSYEYLLCHDLRWSSAVYIRYHLYAFC